MNREKDRLIKDFTALLEVPEVENILRNKIEELKYRYKDSIAEVAEISRVLDPDQPEAKVLETGFEILRKDIGWIPVLPGHDEPYKIVPKKVFDEILNSSAEPDTIVMNYPIKIAGGRLFLVTFEKQDEHYYSGIIIEKQKKSTQGKETARSQGNESLPTTRTEALKLLMNYLLKYEVFRDYILREFMFKWKLLLDRGLIVSKPGRAESREP